MVDFLPSESRLIMLLDYTVHAYISTSDKSVILHTFSKAVWLNEPASWDTKICPSMHSNLFFYLENQSFACRLFGYFHKSTQVMRKSIQHGLFRTSIKSNYSILFLNTCKMIFILQKENILNFTLDFYRVVCTRGQTLHDLFCGLSFTRHESAMFGDTFPNVFKHLLCYCHWHTINVVNLKTYLDTNNYTHTEYYALGLRTIFTLFNMHDPNVILKLWYVKERMHFNADQKSMSYN